MKKILLLSLAFAFTFMSCQSDQKDPNADSIVLAGSIANPGERGITIMNREGSERVKTDVEDGTFSVEVPLTEAGYVDVYVGRSSATIYAAPGDSVHMSADEKALDSTLVFTADHAAENNFLAGKSKYLNANPVNRLELYSKNYEDFAKSMDERKADVLAYYDKNAKGVCKDFLNLDKKLYGLSVESSKSMYQDMYEYFNKDKKAELPDDHDQLMAKAVDLTDVDILKARGFSSMVSTILENQEPKLDYYETGAKGYYKGLFERATKLENPAIKEAASFNSLKDFISFGGGLDNVTTEVDDYMAMNPTATHKKAIDELVAKWEPLKRGKVAPIFSAKHLDDSDFSSADLKGKNIYVDVWATWCGPCKREIPHLKEIEKEYHGKNIEFLSISVDEAKSSDKWKEFVKNEELGGLQVHAPEAFDSEVVESYKINGIPRFLLIDTEGNIVSANAPRPSMGEDLRKMLDNLLEAKI